MKSMRINEKQRNTMEVFRGPEANLESSKGFDMGSRSFHTDVTPMLQNPGKSMKMHEDRETHENRWKSKKYDGSSQRTRTQPGIEQRCL